MFSEILFSFPFLKRSSLCSFSLFPISICRARAVDFTAVDARTLDRNFSRFLNPSGREDERSFCCTALMVSSVLLSSLGMTHLLVIKLDCK